MENLERSRINYGDLSVSDWANLISFYLKIQIEGELTEEEKNWVRTITNDGSIISNIEEQVYIQQKIGARLKGIKEL